MKRTASINRALKAKRIWQEFRENEAIKLFAKKKLSDIAREMSEEIRTKFCEIMRETPASPETWDMVIAFLEDDEEHGK